MKHYHLRDSKLRELLEEFLLDISVFLGDDFILDLENNTIDVINRGAFYRKTDLESRRKLHSLRMLKDDYTDTLKVDSLFLKRKSRDFYICKDILDIDGKPMKRTKFELKTEWNRFEKEFMVWHLSNWRSKKIFDLLTENGTEPQDTFRKMVDELNKDISAKSPTQRIPNIRRWFLTEKFHTREKHKDPLSFLSHFTGSGTDFWNDMYNYNFAYDYSKLDLFLPLKYVFWISSLTTMRLKNLEYKLIMSYILFGVDKAKTM